MIEKPCIVTAIHARTMRPSQGISIHWTVRGAFTRCTNIVAKTKQDQAEPK
jgi:hypothetical protein